MAVVAVVLVLLVEILVQTHLQIVPLAAAVVGALVGFYSELFIQRELAQQQLQ
jgi:hypothetical protein